MKRFTTAVAVLLVLALAGTAYAASPVTPPTGNVELDGSYPFPSTQYVSSGGIWWLNYPFGEEFPPGPIDEVEFYPNSEGDHEWANEKAYIGLLLVYEWDDDNDPETPSLIVHVFHALTFYDDGTWKLERYEILLGDPGPPTTPDTVVSGPTTLASGTWESV